MSSAVKTALTCNDQHFHYIDIFFPTSLWSQCEESPDGKIIFGEFLAKLGVDVSPGDLVGPSTRIQVLSDLSEQQRQADLDIRLVIFSLKNHLFIYSAYKQCKRQ